jgi:hypothetical protein
VKSATINWGLGDELEMRIICIMSFEFSSQCTFSKVHIFQNISLSIFDNFQVHKIDAIGLI